MTRANEDRTFFIFFGVIFGFTLIVLSLFLAGDTPTQIRQQAIEAGVAEWQIDAVTGDKSFEWKVCDDKSE